MEHFLYRGTGRSIVNREAGKANGDFTGSRCGNLFDFRLSALTGSSNAAFRCGHTRFDCGVGFSKAGLCCLGGIGLGSGNQRMRFSPLPSAAATHSLAKTLHCAIRAS